MKGTLHRDGNRATLRFERRLEHAPENVWRALTENDELRHWFPARIDGPRAAGAAIRFVFPPKPGQVPADTAEEGPSMEGTMRVFDPPRLLEYDWGGEILRWTLAPAEGGTLLVFTHSFEDVAKSARDASGWDVCLDSMERRLDGRTPAGFTPQRFDALFDDYAERFGPEASATKRPDMDD
jgi:uncharacterized protein YndB with AHSA1/START domain